MSVQRSGSGVSRRRVLIGTAWATPAIMVGVGVPQAAASVTPPLPDIDITVNPGGANVADIDVGIDVTSSLPAGTVIESGFTITLMVPRDDATLTGVSYDPTLFSVTPEPGTPEANGADTVTFTYIGPQITTPTSGNLSVGAQWNNGVDSNAGEDDRTVVWSFGGTVNGTSTSTGGSVVVPPL